MTHAGVTFRYESNATVADVADRLRQAQRVLVTTHSKPDGDAMGSALALARSLHGMDKAADIFLMGPVDAALRQIAEQTPYALVENRGPDDEYDLIVIMDTGSWTQLEPLADWLRARRSRVTCIDHHAQGDDVADLRLVETGKASTTQLLLEVVDELGVPLDGARGGVAEAIFVGLATDTGWFKFPNADAEAFAVTARLLACGVDKARLYQTIEETAEPSRLALEARALLSVRFVKGGEVAIMTLGPEDFLVTGGAVEELTGLVNQPMQVRTVRVSILLAEAQRGLTKISFRSKAALDGAPMLDVNRLARQFGGGGHPNAAGAKVRMGVQEAAHVVADAVERDRA